MKRVNYLPCVVVEMDTTDFCGGTAMSQHGTASVSGLFVEGLLVSVVQALPRELSDEDARLLQRGGEVLRRHLASALQATLSELRAAAHLLRYITSVAFPGNSEPFVVKDRFKVDMSRKSAVKISYLGDDFRSWFMEQTVPAQAGHSLSVSQLTKASLDEPIMTELGRVFETDLAAVYHLMKQQPNGEEGVLLTSGYANIFYVNGRAVRVRWFGDGWYVGADSVDVPGRWWEGDQVFSRNS